MVIRLRSATRPCTLPSEWSSGGCCAAPVVEAEPLLQAALCWILLHQAEILGAVCEAARLPPATGVTRLVNGCRWLLVCWDFATLCLCLQQGDAQRNSFGAHSFRAVPDCSFCGPLLSFIL